MTTEVQIVTYPNYVQKLDFYPNKCPSVSRFGSTLRILCCAAYTAQYILDAGTSDAVYAIEVNAPDVRNVIVSFTLH